MCAVYVLVVNQMLSSRQDRQSIACYFASPFDCCLIDLASSNVSLTYYLLQEVSKAASHLRDLFRLEEMVQKNFLVPALVRALLRVEDRCDEQDLHECSSFRLQVGEIEVLLGSV